MEVSKRFELLEQRIREILGQLQQQATTLPREPTSRLDTIISCLDNLSKSVHQLREDCAAYTIPAVSPPGSRRSEPRPDSAEDERHEPGGTMAPSTANFSSSSVLSVAEMGYKLVASLTQYGTDFSGKVRISGLGSCDLASISKRLVDPHASSTRAVQHSSASAKGVSILSLSWNAKFRFPDFSDLPQTPPHKYDKVFETVIASPPRRPVVYYVGSPLAPDFDTLLSPGKLLELGNIPSITTPYWHAGEKNSGTAFHYEDGAPAARAFKDTAATASQQTDKQDKADMFKEKAANSCPASPSSPQLDLMEISDEGESEIDEDTIKTSSQEGADQDEAQAADSAAETSVASSHGISTGESSDTRRSSTEGPSANTRPASLPTPVTPSPTIFSGQYSAHFTTSFLAGHQSLKRVLTHPDVSKRPRLDLASAEELLRADQQCNIPSFNKMAPPHAHLLKLATAVRSRYAVKQFCDLVSAKRNLQLQNILFPRSHGANAEQRLRILDELRNNKVITHLNQYLFAAEIEKSRDGSYRVRSNVKEKVIQNSGLTVSQYDYHLRLGKIWRGICRGFEGMLCFILSDKHNPFQVSPAMYRNMDSQELRLFHSLLDDDYTRAICIAGKAFQQSFVTHDAYFAWETKELSKPLYELPEDDMLSLIQPVPSLMKDYYCAMEFSDWPDPTLLAPTEKQCDYCTSSSCNCYSSVPDAKPRIMVYPGKRLGLQAISAEPRATIYRRHDLIGFITSKLVPPNSLNNNRVVDFYKCQIDCRNEGNVFRLLNHTCAKHAVACLTAKRLSSRYRLAVIAYKNINNSAEITISYQPERPIYTYEICESA
ncbi:hypothetical protein M406DRAFT_75468 [Cryphonectria parasitica EP155]|uniref:SET domain-containing protein n=1 Tax=Cryphonectria parasitica (strain ATCC 38755 / EP155) TaxID=660469 RepID=A0A9P5CSG0_CRYP1|nr:uncharacterized protein M406DRAFT_75468 [Cryphonectria parasitica EP155]KAF3768291.1 hypothetical protein M406DRAFT_75468 [Cryphonectria parasitica EP155]